MDGYDTASPSKSPTAHGHKKWIKKEKIGQGAQGTVYRCVDAATGRIVAMKEVNIKGLSDHEIDALTSEATVMKSLSHKHIVQYYGVRHKKRTLEISMEYMPGGSLSAYIRSVGGSLTLDRTKSYTWQLLRAVQFLHDHRIAHRDIKSANVLLTDDQSQIKLADFGALKEIGSVSVVGGLKGTPHWMAPEVIKEQQTSEGWMKADIWSLGCTVLEMLTGRTPWQEYSNPLTAMYKIVSSESTPQVPSDLPLEATSFLESCFQRDPTKRPSASELLHSAFLKSVRKQKKKARDATESPKAHSANNNKSSADHSPRPCRDGPESPPCRSVVDSMPKSKIHALVADDALTVSKQRKSKKPIRLEPLAVGSTSNQEKSTPRSKAKVESTIV
ncbi:STE/STE11 protein kinase [Aphanomyces invadans]|uniref:STE/STE11 protein kinase n=1 Tax=Aphanomyces invadans TaxID=157072 RepID=A0A024U8T7_9STRA|nr:STE/STE11 protein kinase [Aphanomyces invadans]ETW02292.1 STE/STE11 protein kinase [Aphanomyces invadans]|eukprot:XP_008868897.1 STE/STE11 protein kinase [Aphanomyces invadans]